MSGAASKLLADISRSINTACLTGALIAQVENDTLLILSHGSETVEIGTAPFSTDMGIVKKVLEKLGVPERAGRDFLKAFARARGIPLRIEEGSAPAAGEIAKGWASYLVTVLPPDASKIQLWETRRAFYAGAQHFLMSVMRIMDPQAEPTEADLGRLEAMDQELQAFAREVADGRA